MSSPHLSTSHSKVVSETNLIPFLRYDGFGLRRRLLNLTFLLRSLGVFLLCLDLEIAWRGCVLWEVFGVDVLCRGLIGGERDGWSWGAGLVVCRIPSDGFWGGRFTSE